MRRAVPDDRRLRLDGVRWPGGVRPNALARPAAVAALLLTAAGALYGGSPEPSCGRSPVVLPSPFPSGRHPASSPGHPSVPAHQGGRGRPGDAVQAGASAGPRSVGSGGAVDAGVPVGGSRREPAGDAVAPPGYGAPPHRLPVPPGAVGVVVALADPVTLTVLRAGDRVDLLTSAAHRASRPSVLAARALVLATPDTDLAGGAGLYLALRPEQADTVMTQPPGARFSVLVRS